MENFDSLMKIFNILKSSIQSIQNQAFSLVYLHFQYIYVCSLLAPSVAPSVLLYNTHLKACKINDRKVRDVSNGGWWGFPKERQCDDSCGQNRYVTLSLFTGHISV